MKLDKSICKDARLKGVDIVGLKIGNSDYLFETTGPEHLNIYTIRLPYGTSVQATVYNNDIYSIKNEKNYTPIINWGEGTTITDDSGNRVFTHSYNTYGMSGEPYYKNYKIKTTCELIVSNDFPGNYVVDIVSVRTDYLNGYSLFAGYSGIKTIREPVLERLNTSIFNYMNNMFDGCTSLEVLNLRKFNTSNVYDMSEMFNGCTALAELDLSNFNILPQTSVNRMLNNCTSLHTLCLDNCNKDTIEKIITSKGFPTNKLGQDRIIYCSKDVAGELERPLNWKFSFDLEDEEEPEIPVEPEVPEIPLYEHDQFRDKTNLITVETMVNASHVDLSYMFSGCTNLVSVNTNDWNTSNVRYMNNMFQNCSSLVSLDLRYFDTYSIGTGGLEYMFSGCSSLEMLDLRNFYIDYWDVEEDYVARYMFKNCTSLSEIHLDNCNAFTIDQILAEVPYRSSGDGVIYCKKANMRDEEKEINNYNSCPGGWRFEYID